MTSNSSIIFINKKVLWTVLDYSVCNCVCQCSGSRPDSCRVYGDVTVGFSLMYSHQSSRQQLWTREKHRWLISSQCFTECYCGAQTEAQTEASSKVQLLNEIHFQVINADQWRTWSSCVHHKKERVSFDFLTQQFVQGVSCSAAVGLWGHQRTEGDLSKRLQAGGDPAGKHKRCEHSMAGFNLQALRWTPFEFSFQYF